jgi:hypothetical protein
MPQTFKVIPRCIMRAVGDILRFVDSFLVSRGETDGDSTGRS